VHFSYTFAEVVVVLLQLLCVVKLYVAGCDLVTTASCHQSNSVPFVLRRQLTSYNASFDELARSLSPSLASVCMYAALLACRPTGDISAVHSSYCFRPSVNSIVNIFRSTSAANVDLNVPVICALSFGHVYIHRGGTAGGVQSLLRLNISVNRILVVMAQNYTVADFLACRVKC